MVRLFWMTVIFISLIKLSFYQSYVSTDFEVHRNWLAITYNLPIKNWYFDNTSKWTMDYPPFFSWFQWSLSQVAVKIDRNMTVLENLNYMSDNTRLFQKVSVIFSDSIYIVSVYKLICNKPISKLLNNSLFLILVSLKLMAPFGLLLIDHIHFQYNGMLFGFLFLSVNNVLKCQYLWSAFWFSVLLNFKHIYIYYAPSFGAFLFFHYCFEATKNDSQDKYRFNFRRFLKLVALVVSVFSVSFGPFIVMNQLGQVLSRLFPFDSRGLTHAYWAPNVWSIYNSLDAFFSKMAKILFLNNSGANYSNDMTKGLVEKYEHLVLPNIKPLTTMILTLTSVMPAIIKCRYSKPSISDFLKLLIISGWSAFTFGWHVHEKAILMITLPMLILEMFDRNCLGIGFYISSIGHFSLLPLVSTLPEYTLKISLFLACTCTHYVQLSHVHGAQPLETMPILLRIHFYMLPLVWVVTDFIIPIFMPRFEFLPLMLISIFCATGLLMAYVYFYLYYWTNEEKWVCFQEKFKVSHRKKEQ